MARGRKFVPPPDRDGIWYTHRGADGSDAGTARTELTTTGNMLSTPYSATGRLRRVTTPRMYCNRAQTIYRTVNPFSTFDNRNVIQSFGEHLGDATEPRRLGRKVIQPAEARATHTQPDFLMHHSRNPTMFSYSTQASDTFKGDPTPTPTTKGRFPRLRQEARPGPVSLSTTTAVWFPPSPRSLGSHKASTKVLALSQLPMAKHNSWKYSYKGLPTVYPPVH